MYIMSFFRILDGVTDEIRSMIARFWWGSNNDNQKVYFLSLDKIVLTKTSRWHEVQRSKMVHS